MVASKSFQSLWLPDQDIQKMLHEIERGQIVRWPRSRILAQWPHGYDLEAVNKVSGCPIIIERSITGRYPAA